MGLEVATYISGLNASNPVGVSDPKSQGDDHLRLIKSTLLNTFPNISGAMNASQAELNSLVGVTGTTGTGALVLATSPTISSPTIIGAVAGTPTWVSLQTFPGATLNGTVSVRSGNVLSLLESTNTNNFRWFVNGSNQLILQYNSGTIHTITNAGVMSIGANTVLTTATGAQLSGTNAFTGSNKFTISTNPLLLHGVQGDTYHADLFHDASSSPYDELAIRSRGGLGGWAGAIGFWTGDNGGSIVRRLFLNSTLAQFTVPVQAPVAVSSETSGTLTSASANKHLNLSGGITLNNTVFTANDKMTLEAGGSDRTITRGAGCTMYVNGVDSATATLPANTVGGIHVRSASVFVLTGVV